jgi:predicted metal-dependent hydrolase
VGWPGVPDAPDRRGDSGAPTPEDLQEPSWHAADDPQWDDLDDEFDDDYAPDDPEEFDDWLKTRRRAQAVADRVVARQRPRGVIARETITVDGLKVELRRKGIVTLRLHVEPGGFVWLSLPYRTSSDEAAEMVRRHRRWLDQRLAVMTAPPPAPRLWGELLPDAVTGPALDGLYRDELARVSGELAVHWAAKIGRSPSRWTLRWMTTRWGSCAGRTKRITLNLALAALPVEFLEQVLVHELVHLVEPNHGPGFVAKMDALLPDWRARRAAMRKVKPMRKPV